MNTTLSYNEVQDFFATLEKIIEYLDNKTDNIDFNEYDNLSKYSTEHKLVETYSIFSDFTELVNAYTDTIDDVFADLGVMWYEILQELHEKLYKQ